ncbi:ABC transporter substrate-binding protein [Candidatus Parcubacteria bacterium]|nr:MAG: ABC transporter substrate-binding protein [Candidatus Parcubacteria bacterium]
MKTVKIFGILFFALILLAGVWWYWQQWQSGQPTSLRPVVLQLKWLHQAQFAGNYIAKEKGFYAQEGLDVKIIPFSFESPTIEAVASGKADFGITGADELMLARAKGLPLKAIAVIYKINPVCAYALKASGITRPQDFVGKTVGIERAVDGSDINVGILYKAMMHKLGIDRSQIKEVTIGYDASELIGGKVDVATGYFINEPHLAQEAGYEVNTILMADYGVNMYADVIFTRDELLENNFTLVVKFLRATLRGWQYAVSHQQEAVKAVLRYALNRSASHQAYMLSASVPLIFTGEDPLGWMQKSEWRRIKEILTEQGILTQEISSQDVYTLEALREVYKDSLVKL